MSFDIPLRALFGLWQKSRCSAKQSIEKEVIALIASVQPLRRRALVRCAGPIASDSNINTKNGYTTSTKCISTIALNDGSNIMLRFIVKIVVLMYFFAHFAAL